MAISRGLQQRNQGSSFVHSSREARAVGDGATTRVSMFKINQKREAVIHQVKVLPYVSRG